MEKSPQNSLGKINKIGHARLDNKSLDLYRFLNFLENWATIENILLKIFVV